jgi:hypothetical protein
MLCARIFQGVMNVSALRDLVETLSVGVTNAQKTVYVVVNLLIN